MLEAAMKTTIKTLFQRGFNKSQIARMLCIDRKTVRKVLNRASSGKDIWKDEVRRTSLLDDYKEFILVQIAKGLSNVRIHQELLTLYGVECSYSTLRDYVAKLKKSAPHAYMVRHSLPGEEARWILDISAH